MSILKVDCNKFFGFLEWNKYRNDIGKHSKMGNKWELEYLS